MLLFKLVYPRADAMNLFILYGMFVCLRRRGISSYSFKLYIDKMLSVCGKLQTYTYGLKPEFAQQTTTVNARRKQLKSHLFGT